MPFLTSGFRARFDNLTIELTRIKKSSWAGPYPINPRVWFTYFWGQDEAEQEKVIRTWFYQSEQARETELIRLREKYPTLLVELERV